MKKILIAIIFITYLSSCNKDYSEQFTPYTTNPLNDTTWKTNISNNEFVHQIIPILIDNFKVYIDSFNVATGGTIQFTDSLQITFPPYACVGVSGTISSGKIKVVLIQLRKKGDFIRFGKPTTSFNNLLQTGGSFNVLLTQNGFPISLGSNVSYKIKYRDPAPTNDMRFFNEVLSITSADTIRTWQQNDSAGSVNIWQQTLPQPPYTTLKGYEITSKKLSWINCDFFNDTTQPYTRLNVSLPLNFTNSNTAVYLVFKNKNIIARLRTNIPTKTYYFGRIPIGSEVKLVSISKIGNEFYLGAKEITVQNANLISLNPEQKPIAVINTFLDSL